MEGLGRKVGRGNEEGMAGKIGLGMRRGLGLGSES